MQSATETDKTHTDTPVNVRNIACKSKVTHMQTIRQLTDIRQIPYCIHNPLLRYKSLKIDNNNNDSTQ